MRIFIGTDPRQPVAPQVLAMSIMRRASKPVSITPLVLQQLPIKRVGLTQFTFSRYLVPYLCNFEGQALFLDADMLVLGDIHELASLASKEASVSLVKNKQRFEWPSLMYFNCDKCKALTPEYIERGEPQSLAWAEDGIHELPPEWNHCIGYDKKMPDAKLAHFTMGIPVWEETNGCEFTKEWFEELKLCNSTVTYAELMGKSVHSDKLSQLRM